MFYACFYFFREIAQLIGYSVALLSATYHCLLPWAVIQITAGLVSFTMAFVCKYTQCTVHLLICLSISTHFILKRTCTFLYKYTTHVKYIKHLPTVYQNKSFRMEFALQSMSDHIKPLKTHILASETSPVMFKFIAILSQACHIYTVHFILYSYVSTIDKTSESR